MAGSRRGLAPEAPLADTPFSTDVDWRAEVAAARRARADADAASRDPELLARFAKEARPELGAAGAPLLAAKTEQLREEWVADRLVEAGRSRAKSLGWPDAYAYTKALAERALSEKQGDVPVTIVRPSIIESALAEPQPGWIRGFRMAEPVIISYGRGLLKEFPGIPEGVVDVIPVDLVVADHHRRGGQGPRARREPPCTRWPPAPEPAALPPRWSTSSREYFRRAPALRHRAASPSSCRDWSVPRPGPGPAPAPAGRQGPRPGREGRRPPCPSGASGPRSPPGSRSAGTRASGPWTTSSSTAPTPRPRPSSTTTGCVALWDSLDADDQAAFGFDTTVIDWTHYVQDIHLPSVVQPGPGPHHAGRASARADALRPGQAAPILSPDRHMAAFDLENTLIASNVVESYSWLATRRLPDDERARFVAQHAGARARACWPSTGSDRGDFLRHFYRRYEGAPRRPARATTRGSCSATCC